MILRKFNIALILFLITIKVFSQTAPNILKVKLIKSKADSNRVHILLDIGTYYRNLPDKKMKDIDTALVFFKSALILSRNLHLIDYEMKTQSLISSIYFHKRDIQTGKPIAKAVIEHYRKTKNIKLQAEYTLQLALDFPAVTPAEFAENINWYEEASRLYGLAHNKLAQLNAMNNIAYLNYLQGKYDLAEKQWLDLISQYHMIGYNKLIVVYDLLARLAKEKQDTKMELEYRLKVMDNIKVSKDTTYTDAYCSSLAQTYFSAAMYNDCIKWANEGLRFGLNNKTYNYLYINMAVIVKSLIILKRPAEAIALIVRIEKIYKPGSLMREILNYKALGDCYNAQGNFQQAKRNFLIADSLFKIQIVDKNFGTRTKAADYEIGHYIDMGIFFVTNGKFQDAQPFANKALSLPRGSLPIIYKSNFEWLQFKLDSAAGNYLTAIPHLIQYQIFKDTVFNETKSKQIADMAVKYETSKKEESIKALQIKEQKAILESNIKQADLDKVSLQRDLQTGELKQASLQHKIQESKLQSITMQRHAELQQASLEHNVQQAELQKSNLQRNITFGGVAMLMVVSGLTYNGYRNKRRSNWKLEAQKAEINRQNLALQGLIVEKEWLLKEVHHRVKNNLQIIMSLLSSQSAYLENSEAIEAIRESQNRVQAISLIHQKLYSSSNVASINMPAYVTDLLKYLADSFDIRNRKIRFEQVIETFNLDLAQAVPLGLILNEAVTNAIKYAFGADGGQIVVGLQLIKNKQLLLTIADDGRGFAADFNKESSNTLGMEMMKALSKQLGGELKIENKGGATISIEFQIENISNQTLVGKS